jgi:hypothetical protein
MDSKIDSIKNLINNKKEKYPNISNIWLTFLNYKINSLKKSLEDADKIFKNIDNTISQDLPIDTITFLYVLNQI